MKSIYRKIASVLAFIIGAMAIFAGGQVLLGKIMDYYVIDWLPIYNVIAGLISSFVVSILIWKNNKASIPGAIGMITSHGIVMLVLQTAYRDLVAPASIKAMTVRIVVWLVILALMVVQSKKNNTGEINAN